MPQDEDMRQRVREALDSAERLDARRVDVTTDGSRVILRGSVATPEDASVALLLASEHAEDVVDRFGVDPHLREGTADPVRVEAVAPPEGEILVDPLDMPGDVDAQAASDQGVVLGENEPWVPPDEPHLAPTAAEERGGPDHLPEHEPASRPGDVEDDGHASAPELSAEELHAQGERLQRGTA